MVLDWCKIPSIYAHFRCQIIFQFNPNVWRIVSEVLSILLLIGDIPWLLMFNDRGQFEMSPIEVSFTWSAAFCWRIWYAWVPMIRYNRLTWSTNTAGDLNARNLEPHHWPRSTTKPGKYLRFSNIVSSFQYIEAKVPNKLCFSPP